MGRLSIESPKISAESRPTDNLANLLLHSDADLIPKTIVFPANLTELLTQSGYLRMQGVQMRLTLLEPLLLVHQHGVDLVHLGNPSLERLLILNQLLHVSVDF